MARIPFAGTGRFHWSNCAPSAQFVGINAAASLPWLALILFPGMTTLYVALALTAILIFIEVVKKMAIIAFVRSVFVMATGRKKPTIGLLKEVTR